MTQAPPTLTKSRELATFGASVAYEDLPAEVVHCAKRALVDWTAAVLAGTGEPAAGKVRTVVASLAAEGPVRVAGTTQTSNAAFAALAMAYASHLLDFDDVFNPVETTIHLSSCLWPTVLALGQWRRLSGKAAIAAYVAGFETGARAARAAGPGHYQSGWHVTGTIGHLAAVAAASNALGLSPAAATHALGTAATQAAGLREIYGSDTKAIHTGKAAMDGVLSALLAEAGFTSTDTAIEGERGLLAAVTPTSAPELLVEGLHATWHLLENGHKLYPTASLTHAAIEAMIAAERPAPAEVESIEVRMHPFAAAVTALAQPKTGAEARFSTPHCVAVALLHGSLHPSDFNGEVVNDPAVVALRARVAIVSDESIDKRGCRITIGKRGGGSVVAEIERNRGTPAAPLRDEELADKLAYHARAALGEKTASALIERCWSLDTVADLNELVRLMVPA